MAMPEVVPTAMRSIVGRSRGAFISARGPIAIAMLFSLIVAVPFTTVSNGLSTDVLRKGSEEGLFFNVSFPEGGGRDSSLSIPLTGGGPVLSGSIMVSTVPNVDPPYSVSIDVGFDSKVEWTFGGGDEGGFGHQDRFIGARPAVRTLGSPGGGSLSFLIPEGAALRSAGLDITSPPSPTGLLLGGIPLKTGPSSGSDSFCPSDLDGDGQDDLVWYDGSGSRLLLSMAVSQGGPSSVLESSVTGPVHVRAVSRTDQHPGFIVASYIRERSLSREIALFVHEDGLAPDRVVLSDNISVGSVGFSERSSDDGNSTVLFISGRSGALYNAGIDRKGNIRIQLVMDNSMGLTEPYLLDIDGDGDMDIVLLGQDGDGPGAIVMEALTGEEVGSYSRVDVNTSMDPGCPGAVCDADGDGREEVYFVSRQDGELSLLFFGGDAGYIVRSTGIASSNGTVRSLDPWSYGKGGAYLGGEGFLYMSSEKGLLHLMPELGPEGAFLQRPSSGLSPGSIIGLLDQQGEGKVYSLGEDGNLSIYLLDWIWQSSSSLKDLVSGDSLTVKISPPYLRAGNPNDISSIIHPELAAQRMMDAYGNPLCRIDLMVTGETSYLKVHGLSVRYDVTLDASSSTSLLPALRRSQLDFDDQFIPFTVIGSSEGSVVIGPVNLVHDALPRFSEGLPGVITIREDSLAETVMSPRDHIIDDRMDPWELTVDLLPSEDMPEGLLFLDRNYNLISHASAFPDLQGSFTFQLAISDASSTVLSTPIALEVLGEEDSPRAVDQFRSIIIPEGSSSSLRLTGEDGLFWDPDGDALTFDWKVRSPYPPESMEHVDISISAGSLVIFSDVDGRGCQFRIEVFADDLRMPSGQEVSSVLKVEVIDVDSPPRRGIFNTVLEMSEDQSLPTRIKLEEWMLDADTDLVDCTFIATSSDPRLISYIEEDMGRPYLFIQPTKDLTGQHSVYLEMRSNSFTLVDELTVNVIPVNDLPVIVADSKRDLEGKGWMVTGHVEDPDDTGGKVQYMVAGGVWQDAWGFNIWTFVVNFDELPPSGGYVFVKANDGTDDSASIFVKLVPPEKVPVEVPDDMDQDQDDDGVTPPDDGGPFIVPERDDGRPGIWYVLFGILSGTMAALVGFVLLTEVGFVSVLTAIMSAYSKLSKKDILNHEIRGLIRGYIIANPGDHYSSIKRNLDLNNGTLAYHLRVLEQNGLIKSMYDGIYKRYYPANVNISKLKKNISKQEEIFNIILDNPGITMEQIGRSIGVSRQVVNYHVKNLIRAGAISYQRDNKSARFFSTDRMPLTEDT